MDFVLPSSFGPPKLEHLCVKSLVDYKIYISDIGDMPLALLEPVLAHCSAQHLREIEDATR
jgi:RNA polymerase II transcription factor SIII (Elongin) subunit A